MSNLERRIRCNENGIIYKSQSDISRRLRIRYYDVNTYFRYMHTDNPRSSVGGYSFEYVWVNKYGEIVEAD